MATQSIPESVADTFPRSAGFPAHGFVKSVFRFMSGPIIPIAVLLVVLVIPALFAPWIALHNPTEVNPVNRLQPPVFSGGTWDYPLGTDTLGRDVLSRMMHGARVSFFISLSALTVALVIGASTGLAAGYLGSWVDHLLMRLVDVKIALPDILIALVIVAIVGPSVLIALVIVVFFTWSIFARITRAQVLVLRELDFVALAKIAGAGRFWIIRKHILPNVTNTLLVVSSLTIGIVILLEATLSFLGVGIPRPTPAWGVMVADGRDYVARAWWLSTFPGLAIVIVVLAFNFLGDWLRDRLDPSAATLYKGEGLQEQRSPFDPGNRQEEKQVVLEVRNLRTALYNRKQTTYAVDGVSFSLREGETLGIVGESGSGKTMTARSLMLLPPEPAAEIVGGQILLDGEDILKLNKKERRSVRGKKIAIILQDPQTSLNPVFSIGDQLTEVIRSRADSNLSEDDVTLRAVTILRRMGVAAAERRVEDYPHQMSGGMKQRVVGGIAIESVPRVLIADEPTTALDVTIQAQYLRLLKEIQKDTGVAIIFITHDLGIVAQMCDNVAVMYAGRIVEQGTIREIFKSPAHPYTEALLNSVPKVERRVERLYAIEGQPPAMFDLPNGCYFEPRCPYADDTCREKYPPVFHSETGQTAACWRLEKQWSTR